MCIFLLHESYIDQVSAEGRISVTTLERKELGSGGISVCTQAGERKVESQCIFKSI